MGGPSAISTPVSWETWGFSPEMVPRAMEAGNSGYLADLACTRPVALKAGEGLGAGSRGQVSQRAIDQSPIFRQMVFRAWELGTGSELDLQSTSLFFL